MSVTRDKRNGTWYVQAWYKTYDGKRAHKVKRGFKTKPEALSWERDFYAVQAGDMDMKLVDFLELYKKDMGPRLRLNTWKTKESIITKRILPYLGEKRMNQIAPVDIVRWQNELMALEKPSGGGFSATYLKTVNNQLCALFNHAVRFYGLSSVFSQVLLSEKSAPFFRVSSRKFFGFRRGHAANFLTCPA